MNTCTCNCNFSEIEKLVEQDKDRPTDSLSTLARIQRIQHMTLVWTFAKVVSDYNEVLLKQQERCRAIVRQQLMISKLSVSENRVLGVIFGHTREEATAGWRYVHNEERHDVYSEHSAIFTQI
jgi:hypothetical protein